MGVVYRARHDDLGRDVALKVIKPEHAADEGFRERFKREWRTLAALHHRNILTVYDAGEADGHLFIAMQFIQGTDLGGLVRKSGPLAPSRALQLLSQAARALDAAHARDVIHRDVKPANLLLDDRHTVYLSDFGLAKDRIGKKSERYVGTPHYSSPEQLENLHPLDARTDVYSLGVVLFECVTGRLPFEGTSPYSVAKAHLADDPPAASSLRNDLPPELDAVISKALAKAPEERFGSCSDLIQQARAAVPRATRERKPEQAHDDDPADAAGAGLAAAAIGGALALFGKKMWDSWKEARPSAPTLSPHRLPAPSPLAQVLPGAWSVSITGPGGSSWATVVLNFDGSFHGRLTNATGVFDGQGVWRIVAPSQIELTGQLAPVGNPIAVSPWTFGVAFDGITRERLTGTTTGQERVVWERTQ